MFNELSTISSSSFLLLLIVFLTVGLINPTIFKLKRKKIIAIFLVGLIIPLFFFIRINFIYDKYARELNSIIEGNQGKFSEVRMDAFITEMGDENPFLAIEMLNEFMEELTDDIEKVRQINAPGGFGLEEKKEETISAFTEQHNLIEREIQEIQRRKKNLKRQKE